MMDLQEIRRMVARHLNNKGISKGQRQRLIDLEVIRMLEEELSGFGWTAPVEELETREERIAFMRGMLLVLVAERAVKL